MKGYYDNLTPVQQIEERITLLFEGELLDGKKSEQEAAESVSEREGPGPQDGQMVFNPEDVLDIARSTRARHARAMLGEL